MLLRIAAFACLALMASASQASDDCATCRRPASVVVGGAKKVAATTAQVVGAVIPGNRQSCHASSHCSSHHRKVFKGRVRRACCRR